MTKRLDDSGRIQALLGHRTKIYRTIVGAGVKVTVIWLTFVLALTWADYFGLAVLVWVPFFLFIAALLPVLREQAAIVFSAGQYVLTKSALVPASISGIIRDRESGAQRHRDAVPEGPIGAAIRIARRITTVLLDASPLTPFMLAGAYILLGAKRDCLVLAPQPSVVDPQQLTIWRVQQLSRSSSSRYLVEEEARIVIPLAAAAIGERELAVR